MTQSNGSKSASNSGSTQGGAKPSRSTAAFASSYASGFVHGNHGVAAGGVLQNPMEDLGAIVTLRETLSRPTSRGDFVNLIAPLVQRCHQSPCAVMVIEMNFIHHLYDPMIPNPATQYVNVVAEKLMQTLPLGSIIGRTGMHEFAAMIRDIDNHSAVNRLCASVLRNTYSPTTETDALVGISTSIGWATAPYDAKSAHDLMLLCERALIKARTDGGNCAIHTDDLPPISKDTEEHVLVRAQAG